MRALLPLLASTALALDQQPLVSSSSSSFACDLPPPVAPSDTLPSASDLFSSPAALQKQVERHAALVRVPSICYDDLGDFDADPRWKVFYELHDVIKKTYPVLYVPILPLSLLQMTTNKPSATAAQTSSR